MTTQPGGRMPANVRARDADRQAAIDALSEAHAEGQLTFDEFEERSRAAASAITLDELMMLTADLQDAPPPPASRGVDASGDFETVLIAAPSGAEQSARRSPRLGLGLLGLGIVAVIAVGVMLLIDVIGNAGGLGGGSDVDLHSRDGYAAFIDDMHSELGTTTVAEAVVYPQYAVVTVPVDGEPKHLQSYYYDGSFDDPSPSGTRTDVQVPVDLATIDGGVLAQLVGQAPDALGVADATSVYAIVESWGDPAQPAVSVYASNDYSESGYLVAATDGHLLDAYPIAE